MAKLKKLRVFLVVGALSLFFFLTLPYPFGRSPLVCNESTQTISECERVNRVEWVWFGGYHIVVERFLPVDNMRFESYAGKYFGITNDGVATLAGVSLILGTSSYFIASKVISNRKR